MINALSCVGKGEATIMNFFEFAVGPEWKRAFSLIAFSLLCLMRIFDLWNGGYGTRL